MTVYDAQPSPEALAQGHETMEQGALMEQATAPDSPVTEPFSDSRSAEVIVTDGYVGPGSETYAIHAKLGGQAAAEEIVELNQQETDTFEGDSAEPNPGFMSKLSGFVEEHPGLTFGVALGAVGTLGTVTAEIASASPVDGGNKPAAKVGKKTPGEASTSAVQPCENSIEATCSYPHPVPQPEAPQKPDKGQGNNGKPRNGNLLPLPRRKTVRYFATQLINENRKGNAGRIKLSKSAKRDINLARKGRCAPIDKIPGTCVKIKKSLLETLYKASLKMRYKVNYITGADHVTCSDHWQGRGADLMRYNGKPPRSKRLLHVFSRVLKRTGRSAQLLGPGDAGHSGSAAHWHIGISGPNPICK